MSTYGYFKHDEMSGYAIAHHGILGQKWGVRRYQNEDGSLTEAGKRRYLIPSGEGPSLRGTFTKKIDWEAYYKYKNKQNKKNNKTTNNKGTKIDKGVNYLKEQLVGPEMVDDPELVQLAAWEAQDLYKLSDEEVDKIIDKFNKK